MGALMKADFLDKRSGFSLVELLVVMVIMGLVMTSIYGLYLHNLKTANTSEEVVDVQQNLRIAYDMMARDIRMAGFSNAQSVIAATGDSLMLSVASPYNSYARIIRILSDPDDATTETTTIDPSSNTTNYYFMLPETQIQYLRLNHVFRITRPKNGRYVPDLDAADTYLVARDNPKQNGGGDWYVRMQVLTTGATPPYTIAFGDKGGDMLARVIDGFYPYDNGHVVMYQLDKTVDTSDGPDMTYLMRRVCRPDGTGDLEPPQIVATKIHDVDADLTDGLRLGYLMVDGNFIQPDPGESITAYGPPYTPDDIIAIQVHLFGSTDSQMTGKISGEKSREVLGRVHIKNRTITSGT